MTLMKVNGTLYGMPPQSIVHENGARVQAYRRNGKIEVSAILEKTWRHSKQHGWIWSPAKEYCGKCEEIAKKAHSEEAVERLIEAEKHFQDGLYLLPRALIEYMTTCGSVYGWEITIDDHGNGFFQTGDKKVNNFCITGAIRNYEI